MVITNVVNFIIKQLTNNTRLTQLTTSSVVKINIHCNFNDIQRTFDWKYY